MSKELSSEVISDNSFTLSSLSNEDNVSISDNSEIYIEDISESSCIESSESYKEVPHDVSKLWNKRDYYYKLDETTRNKIISNFEKALNNEEIEDDVFYDKLRVVPVYDITQIINDTYIKERLECRKLREFNIQFLEYARKNYKEIEGLISKYMKCEDEEIRRILRKIIIQKKKNDVLWNMIRNYISEVVIKGEECYGFINHGYNTVFKKSLELATAVSDNSECN